MQGIVDEERQRDHPHPPSARRVATGRPCLGCCSCSPLKGCRTKTSRSAWTPRLRSSVNGANGSSNSVLPGWKTFPEEAAPAVFPVEVMIQIKALACELPYRRGLPLSRFSISEIKREAISQGLVASIGQTTVWRWLSQDAIKPWNHRSWIFPRDPRFREKGARIIDLYAGRWQQKPLLPSDCVLCADEKTSIQARRRCRPGPGWGSGHAVEHEYQRKGAWAYLAAWDIRRARIFGRCEPKTGIEPFGRLVAQVMAQQPYRSASRVFWILDNGSSHPGQACVDRLQSRWKNLIVVHTPVHASWLNQIEIYFSILTRKALKPNHFASLAELKTRILRFEQHYRPVAKPFQWKFTRADLDRLLDRLDSTPGLFDRAA